jgi:hypothetical protein
VGHDRRDQQRARALIRSCSAAQHTSNDGAIATVFSGAFSLAGLPNLSRFVSHAKQLQLFVSERALAYSAFRDWGTPPTEGKLVTWGSEQGAPAAPLPGGCQAGAPPFSVRATRAFCGASEFYGERQPFVNDAPIAYTGRSGSPRAWTAHSQGAPVLPFRGAHHLDHHSLMSRALANLGLAVFLILTAAFLTRSFGLELHVVNATMVNEIDAARLLVHLVGAGEHCVTCVPNGGLPGPLAATIEGNDNVRISGVRAATFPDLGVSRNGPPVIQPRAVSMTRQPAHAPKYAARHQPLSTKIAQASPPLSLAPPIPAGR